MKTISKQRAHQVFMYGTHKQLENSIKRWLKNGIATMSDVYNALSYMVKRELETKELKELIKELELVVFTRENVPLVRYPVETNGTVPCYCVPLNDFEVVRHD